MDQRRYGAWPSIWGTRIGSPRGLGPGQCEEWAPIVRKATSSPRSPGLWPHGASGQGGLPTNVAFPACSVMFLSRVACQKGYGPAMTLALGGGLWREPSGALFTASWASRLSRWKSGRQQGGKGSGDPCPSKNDHETSPLDSASSFPGTVLQKKYFIGFSGLQKQYELVFTQTCSRCYREIASSFPGSQPASLARRHPRWGPDGRGLAPPSWARPCARTGTGRFGFYALLFAV